MKSFKFTTLDINECLTGTACHVNADCTNTIGSFACQCRPGYVGDGINCAGWYSSFISK